MFNIYRIPEKIIEAIPIMYDNTAANVVSHDGNTDYFEILSGVLQGATLTPFLFIINIDFALRKATEDHKALGFTFVKRRSRRYSPQRITDTYFVNDTVTFSDTLQNATLLLHDIDITAKQVNPLKNEKKTKFMSFNLSGIIQSLNGVHLKEVTDYKYLGSHKENTVKDTNSRISIP